MDTITAASSPDENEMYANYREAHGERIQDIKSVTRAPRERVAVALDSTYVRVRNSINAAARR